MNCLGLLSPALVLLVAAPAPEVATIKGRLVWPAKVAVPDNPIVNAVRDREHCTAKGPIRKDELIVHPKNRGIKNAVFFLIDAKVPLKVLPAPSAKKLAKAVEIDIPCCQFEPRITVLAPGQKLIVKNSSKVAHAVRLDGKAFPVSLRLLAREKTEEHGPGKPALLPAYCSCPIHPWMRAYVFTPPSPYFAVTDADGRFVIKNAPKGTYRLVGWHERIGWIFPRVVGAVGGKRIEIKGGVNDVGEFARDEH
jgi:hypothetical protein